MIKNYMASQINWPIKETPTITERQKNCPYCHEKGGGHRVKMIEDDPDGQAGLASEQDGWHLWIAVPHIFEQVFCPFEMLHPIKYCPMCGRPLNEEEKQ